jgi:hypothetical protein
MQLALSNTSNFLFLSKDRQVVIYPARKDNYILN